MKVSWPLLMLGLLVGCSQQPEAANRAAPQLLSNPAEVALHAHCSACHAPPHADRHTASEWPQVISRMELHRLQRGFDTIPVADRALLLSLLQSGARP